MLALSPRAIMHLPPYGARRVAELSPEIRDRQPLGRRLDVGAIGHAGPHAAHSSPSGVERHRRPWQRLQTCHGPVVKVIFGSMATVASGEVGPVVALVGHGMAGGSAA